MLIALMTNQREKMFQFSLIKPFLFWLGQKNNLVWLEKIRPFSLSDLHI